MQLPGGIVQGLRLWPVDVIEHGGMVGIASGLAERSLRKRILSHNLAQWMLLASRAEFSKLPPLRSRVIKASKLHDQLLDENECRRMRQPLQIDSSVSGRLGNRTSGVKRAKPLRMQASQAAIHMRRRAMRHDPTGL